MTDAADDIFRQARPYVYPACTYIAAAGLFMGGQSRIVPLFSGNNKGIQHDNSDDGLIPLLNNLGVRFNSDTATSVIGFIKVALAAGLLYAPARQTTARFGFAYLALGLVSRLHQGLTPTPILINMALLSVPARLFDNYKYY